MNPFQSLRSYERFVYTLQQKYPSIQRSTLVIVQQRGSSIATLRGDLMFHEGYRVTISERLVVEQASVIIDFYGYELWHFATKIAWYDSQPHPHIPHLQSTHPHHKHVPPNIKRNRIPAPNMSFRQPNLPALIAEIETLIATDRSR